MIQFEITQSPDSNAMNLFKFYQNEIYIGRKTGDLLVSDSGLMNSHLMLEVIAEELLVHPQKTVDYYLINGKRATSIRKLKRLDLLQVGQTILKILDFKSSPMPSKKDLLNEKLARLVEENSPRLKVIEELSKMMK